MPFSLLIIGTELLSGKRKDAHLAFAIEALGRRGLELARVVYLTDDPPAIEHEIRQALHAGQMVFSFGGIGSTPDDHTRQAAARAAGVNLERHPEAVRIIEERFGEAAYPRRIRMAELPVGCALIPNPVNQIPGFTLGDVHFVPGFPQMAWPMLEWVLDAHYPHLQLAERPVESMMSLPGTSEGQLLAIMQTLVEQFPTVQLSCLPHMQGDYRETELGIRGAGADVEIAFGWLVAAIEREGLEYHLRAREATSGEIDCRT